MANVFKTGVFIVIAVLAALVLIGMGFHVNPVEGIGGGIFKYVFYGDSSLNSLSSGTITTEIGGIVVAMMIWLIIFVAFGDILENWSAFSAGIGWVIAFEIGVVAANVGLINNSMLALIKIFAWLGTFAIFAALFSSFVAFFVVNWGISSAFGWVRNRQRAIKAATGRTYATEGLKTLTTVGKETLEEGGA